MEHLNESLANKLVEIAQRQFRTGFNFKKQRLDDIRKNEEFYYGRKIKVPEGRFGVPLPTMAGFVDTLMSKIDDPPTLNFKHTDLADLKKMQKASAAWTKDSSPQHGNWARKDRWAKKLACFSGRAIYKYFAESDPKYRSNLEVVDYEDFVCEPMGGGDLEKHLYKGQDGVFRTEDELKRNAKSGLYDRQQVEALIKATSEKDFKQTENLWRDKAERYKMLGLDLATNTYVGQPTYKLIEWVMEFQGKWYYLLFDYRTGVWVRTHPLKEVFESGFSPWVSWATHEDPFNFWSKAPCDDMRPLVDAMDVLFNQALENRQKRNFGQRAYDADIFPDPSELEWRPDGLARGTAASKGQYLSNGIYEFETPEIQGTLDMMQFIDIFGGRKSGIVPEAQGAPEESQKVGIYFGNLQQMADRLGLYNKSYRESWTELGVRYYWGMKEHLNEKMLVKMIGEEGVEWDELRKEDLKTVADFDVEISGGSAEVAANEAKKKERANSLILISKDPVLKMQVNPQWYLQEVLRQGAWDEADVKMAMSQDRMGNLEIISEARKAIQSILKDKEVKPNRAANTIFIQEILNYAAENDMDEDKFVKLLRYAKAHIPIAQRNMIRMARSVARTAKQQPTEEPKKSMLPISEQTMVEEPVLGTKGSPVSKGLEASNLLQGRSPAEE